MHTSLLFPQSVCLVMGDVAALRHPSKHVTNLSHYNWLDQNWPQGNGSEIPTTSSQKITLRSHVIKLCRPVSFPCPGLAINDRQRTPKEKHTCLFITWRVSLKAPPPPWVCLCTHDEMSFSEHTKYMKLFFECQRCSVTMSTVHMSISVFCSWWWHSRTFFWGSVLRQCSADIAVYRKLSSTVQKN